VSLPLSTLTTIPLSIYSLSDLYYLVKFLPAYALPTGMPSLTDVTSLHGDDGADDPAPPSSPLTSPLSPDKQPNITIAPIKSVLHHRERNGPTSPTLLPPPVSVGSPGKRTSFLSSIASPRAHQVFKEKDRMILPRHDEPYLMPAHMPPKYGIFDLFPFSLLVKYLTGQGKEVKGKKGARLRAKLRNQAISHNLPLELSLYLSSYIALLQKRKLLDVPTCSTLLSSLNQLVDSLTGLERILTTPIPFSYSVHLWLVTIIYCLALPFQIWTTLKWLTIPATVILSFFFFGFLVAGEEIENPFGYDKNDLNLDHFTHSIIRNELKAITSSPPPDPSRWAFVAENNLLFSNHQDDRVSPEQWMARGAIAMQKSLSQG